MSEVKNSVVDEITPLHLGGKECGRVVLLFGLINKVYKPSPPCLITHPYNYYNRPADYGTQGQIMDLKNKTGHPSGGSWRHFVNFLKSQQDPTNRSPNSLQSIVTAS